MQHIFILISSTIALISPIVYSIAIFKGKAKPHRTTRLVLLIITSLTTASLFAQHNTVAIYLAAVLTLQSIAIFILSIKYGMGGWGKTDVLCLLLALLGILLWKITDNPRIALYFAIGADFTGVIPTILKTYRLPHTEVWTYYMLGIFAALFSLMAIKVWVVDQYAYPVYIMLINLIIVLLVIRPQSQAKSL
ncbi:MAG: hypothetical protein NUV65_01380 [Candidatus Roizmanbacteria bacterium]|nr:hypothetical protein [Candidatus Roizmanbacteria bacterium]